eukprot:364624-Chlamydomonas_euryale.AAC.7
MCLGPREIFGGGSAHAVPWPALGRERRLAASRVKKLGSARGRKRGQGAAFVLGRRVHALCTAKGGGKSAQLWREGGLGASHTHARSSPVLSTHSHIKPPPPPTHIKHNAYIPTTPHPAQLHRLLREDPRVHRRHNAQAKLRVQWHAQRVPDLGQADTGGGTGMGASPASPHLSSVLVAARCRGRWARQNFPPPVCAALCDVTFSSISLEEMMKSLSNLHSLQRRMDLQKLQIIKQDAGRVDTEHFITFKVTGGEPPPPSPGERLGPG